MVSKGEEEAEPALTLLAAERVAAVLDARGEVCAKTTPTSEDLGEAAALAGEHGLTLYDAAYAAVARRRNAHLVSDLVAELAGPC